MYLFKFFLCGIILLAGLSQAASNSSIGTDFVRTFDKGQYNPDKGLLNLFYQHKLTPTSGFLIGYAWEDDNEIIDASFKLYTQEYLNGPFFQVGIELIDIENIAVYNNNEFAAFGAVGLEQKLSPQLSLGAAAKVVFLTDHPATGKRDAIFMPTITLIFTI